MMECCQLCYEWYINADGTIDQEALKEAMAKHNISEENTLPVACHCPCHNKGSYVIH
jgi:hypothetical protein